LKPLYKNLSISLKPIEESEYFTETPTIYLTCKYSETFLSRTLNKPKSIKVLMSEIFVNSTCINWICVYFKHRCWSHRDLDLSCHIKLLISQKSCLTYPRNSTHALKGESSYFVKSNKTMIWIISSNSTYKQQVIHIGIYTVLT
jgi:hypothetical protein